MWKKSLRKKWQKAFWDKMKHLEIQLDQAELEKTIGYTFNDKSLLKTALTHSSFSNETKGRDDYNNCNERLEFLGDSVLSIVVSDYIYKNFENLDEGSLTRIRAAVVCEGALAEVAKTISLGDYLYLGHGEIVTNGRNRKSITSDATEALLAAIYLDGGIDKAREFILPRLIPLIQSSIKKGAEDYKSKLQRIVQQTPEEIMEYVLVDETGPAHDRMFVMQVRLNSNVLGTGRGHSKREAEQQAAKMALEYFEDDTKA